MIIEQDATTDGMLFDDRLETYPTKKGTTAESRDH
jgi:hypothetical protein